MTIRERAIVMAYTGYAMLTGDKIKYFYKYLEEIMGEPIWTHEVVTRHEEIREKAKDDFIALCMCADMKENEE